MKVLSLTLLALFFTIETSFADLQSKQLEKAWKLYNQVTTQQLPKSEVEQKLSKALNLFKVATNDEKTRRSAALGYIKTSLYSGKFLTKSKKELKSIYRQAYEMGKWITRTHATNMELTYWYVLSHSRWANELSLVISGKPRAIGESRQLCKRIIKSDNKKYRPLAMMLLGRLHHKTPGFPLIMSWPSNDRALNWLEQANQLNPNHPKTMYYLGDLYKSTKRKKEALQILSQAAQVEPRPKEQNEDLYWIQKSKVLLKKLQKK